MRPDPNARSYTLNSFLSEYAPSLSGSYAPPRPYLGSDGLKSILSSAADRVKNMYSGVLNKMKDSYKSVKDNGLFKPDYEPSLAYK